MATSSGSVSLQLPCVALLSGPTGSGKTHLIADLVTRLCKGGPPSAAPRFENKGGTSSDALIKRILYIGQFDGKESPSYDEKHNENIANILKLKPKSEALTLDKFEKIAAEENNTASLIAALVSGKSSKDNQRNAGMKKLFDTLAGDDENPKGMLEQGDLLIIDDLQHFLRLADSKTTAKIIDIINAASHHKGVSVFLLFQSIPSNSNFLASVVNAAHYIIFVTRNGINAGQIRTILQANAGYSKDDYNKLYNGLGLYQASHSGHYPDYCVYNKTTFKHCDEIGVPSSLSGVNSDHTTVGITGKNGKRSSNQNSVQTTAKQARGSEGMDQGSSLQGWNRDNKSTGKKAMGSKSKKAYESPS